LGLRAERESVATGALLYFCEFYDTTPLTPPTLVDSLLDEGEISMPPMVFVRS